MNDGHVAENDVTAASAAWSGGGGVLSLPEMKSALYLFVLNMRI